MKVHKYGERWCSLLLVNVLQCVWWEQCSVLSLNYEAQWYVCLLNAVGCTKNWILTESDFLPKCYLLIWHHKTAYNTSTKLITWDSLNISSRVISHTHKQSDTRLRGYLSEVSCLLCLSSPPHGSVWCMVSHSCRQEGFNRLECFKREMFHLWHFLVSCWDICSFDLP